MSSNMLKEITLENFKAFGPKQIIPLKPITLIYGPNSAGKSAILDALSWISAIITGSDISLWNRLIHHRDDKRLMSVSYKVGLQEHWNDTFEEKEVALFIDDPRIRSIKEMHVEAVIGKPPAMSDGVFRIPMVLECGVTIDKKEFAFANSSVNHSSCLDQIEFNSTLKLVRVNKSHPAAHAIADLTLKTTIQKLNERRQELIELAKNNNNIDFDAGTERVELAIRRVNSINATSLLECVDVDDCKIDFDSQRFPIIPRAGQESKANSVRYTFDSSGGFSIGWTLFDLERENGVLIYLEEVFWQMMASFLRALSDPVEVNLGTSLASDVCRIPSLRSRPRSGLLLNKIDDVASVAPDWQFFYVKPEHVAKQVEKVNEWLKARNRNDTSYEMLVSRVTHTEQYGEETKTDEYVCYKGIRDLRRNVVVELDELGTGFSQLLPVLLAAFANDKICLVEQPELHLHPALQAELADLFILQGARHHETGDETGSMNQFIIETHSEHILLRLMRRIRETKAGTLPPGLPPITHKDVGVLYVDNQGDHAVVREMPLNENGELIRDWPGGFFEEGLREVLL